MGNVKKYQEDIYSLLKYNREQFYTCVISEKHSMNFKSFSFAPEILRAIEECGYQELSPIQRLAIPLVRKGHDVLANAQTGTGKTAAFALPILQKSLIHLKSVLRLMPVY